MGKSGSSPARNHSGDPPAGRPPSNGSANKAKAKAGVGDDGVTDTQGKAGSIPTSSLPTASIATTGGPGKAKKYKDQASTSFNTDVTGQAARPAKSRPKKSKSSKGGKAHRPRLHPTTLAESVDRIFNPCLFPRLPPKPPPMYPPRGIRYSRLPPPCAEVDDGPTWRRRRWRVWDEVYSPLRRVVLNPTLRGQLRRHQTFTMSPASTDDVAYPVKGIHRRVFPRGGDVGMTLDTYDDRPYLTELLIWRARRPKAWAGPFETSLPAVPPGAGAGHGPVPDTGGMQPPLTPITPFPPVLPLAPVQLYPHTQPTYTPPKLNADQRKAKRKQLKTHKWVLDIENERRWRTGMRRLMDEVYDFQSVSMLEPSKWVDGKGVFLPDFDYDDVSRFAEMFKAVRQNPDEIYKLYPDLGPVPGRAEAQRQIEEDEEARKKRKEAKKAKAGGSSSSASPSPPDITPLVIGPPLPAPRIEAPRTATPDPAAKQGAAVHAEQSAGATSLAPPPSEAGATPPSALPTPLPRKSSAKMSKKPKLKLEIDPGCRPVTSEASEQESSPHSQGGINSPSTPSPISLTTLASSPSPQTLTHNAKTISGKRLKHAQPPKAAAAEPINKPEAQNGLSKSGTALERKESASASATPTGSTSSLATADGTACAEPLQDVSRSSEASSSDRSPRQRICPSPTPANPVFKLMQLLASVQAQALAMPAAAAAARLLRADLLKADNAAQALEYGEESLKRSGKGKDEMVRIAHIMGALDRMDAILEREASVAGKKGTDLGQEELAVDLDDGDDDDAKLDGASSASENEDDFDELGDVEDGISTANTSTKPEQGEASSAHTYRLGSVFIDDDTRAPSVQAPRSSLESTRPPLPGVIRRQTMA